ncbi:MarR family transcriptional regulator [Pseudohalocynthiibacter sp. F2068]|uniref:MarR family winged helix-turn-helix transcriptional regulator n=1 Tax=Pseudohalocynthiibacter sp. F2068 TaxID=2926418 RepID=UPI001FF24D61|nr:MarR family transcriptional regulator [Pseudohalocynthiibacter sp. F2068]MCK0103238.1 MarR family transcriptional regulator [Pseudohalocynthiibacter sp. F2068]
MFTDCYCTQFRRSAQALTEIYDSALREQKIRISQFSTLRALDRMGSATMQELAEEVALDKTTISRNVKVLASNGWVDFSSTKDLRQKRVILSSKGIEKLASATISWRRAQEKIRESASEIFSDDSGDPLLETLEKLQQISSNGKKRKA